MNLIFWVPLRRKMHLHPSTSVSPDYLPMIQNQKDYIVAATGFALLLILLTWSSCDRIEKRFDRVYSDLSTQMRNIESKIDEVKGSVDRQK
jgi:hypothetical protein